MKNTTCIIIFIMTIIFCSCSTKTKEISSSNDDSIRYRDSIFKQETKVDSINRLNAMWLQDSNGCLGYRTKELSDYMIEKILKHNTSTSNFLKVFGIPNQSYINESGSGYRYICQTLCVGEYPMKDSDNIYRVYCFKNDTLSRQLVEAE